MTLVTLVEKIKRALGLDSSSIWDSGPLDLSNGCHSLTGMMLRTEDNILEELCAENSLLKQSSLWLNPKGNNTRMGCSASVQVFLTPSLDQEGQLSETICFFSKYCPRKEAVLSTPCPGRQKYLSYTCCSQIIKAWH